MEMRTHARKTVAAALVIWLSAAGAALAATADAPSEGSTMSSTPTFTWTLANGETAVGLEASPEPELDAGGAFADRVITRSLSLAPEQTSVTLPRYERLYAGTWYWHIATRDQAGTTTWTSPVAFNVADEPPVLMGLRAWYRPCREQIAFWLEFDDNAGTQTKWRLTILRHHDSGPAATLRGTAPNVSRRVYFSHALPDGLAVGRAYWATMRLTDPLGQTGTGPPVRLRLKRCST